VLGMLLCWAAAALDGLLCSLRDESIGGRTEEVKTGWAPSTIEDRDGSTGWRRLNVANYLDKLDVHAFRFLQMVYERSAG
jgi:hypothetical protein